MTTVRQTARSLALAAALLMPSLFAQAPTPVPTPVPAPPVTEAQDLNTLRERAFAAENRGDYATAADAFLALHKQEPLRAEWVVAAGRCLGRSRRFKQAVEILDQGRKDFPTCLDLPAMLAGTLLLQSESPGTVYPEVMWADAAELANGVLAVDPNHEDCRLLLAQAHYLLGDWDQAVADAEEAVRRFPTRAGAHLLLGRIATDRFKSLLQQHATEQPAGAEAADLVAKIDQQRQLARRSFERAAELDPSKVHPHIALSQLAELDHHAEQAREHVLHALAIDPEVAVDHDQLLQGLDWQARRDRYRQLRERYAAGTAARPAKAATLRFHEGRADFSGRDWTAARDCMRTALADNPALTHCLYYLFLCDYQLQDFDAAEQHAAAYAAISAAAFADVLRGLTGDQRGEVGAIVKFLADRAYQQQHVPASRDLNHVIACLQDSAAAWNNHAFLCRETGQFDDALSSYQNALEKEPDSPQLWNDTAVVLQYHLASKENLDKARGMYERAIVLADKVLADAGSAKEAREQATEAKQNAQANLAALPH